MGAGLPYKYGALALSHALRSRLFGPRRLAYSAALALTTAHAEWPVPIA
jgi:hypothetical protein